MAVFLGAWRAGLLLGFWVVLVGLLGSVAGFFSVLDFGFFFFLGLASPTQAAAFLDKGGETR